MYMVLVLD